MAPHAVESWSNEKVTSSDLNVDLATGSTSGTKRCPESGISVLIVGAGMGGLMSAMECWRKGHTVRILEKTKEAVFTGQSVLKRVLIFIVYSI